MRVLVTGNRGYIGTVIVPMLQRAGHEVVGLDSDLYAGCDFGGPAALPAVEQLGHDIRDVEAADLRGFDAIVHLAALSNDPLGELNPALTFEINHRATVSLAEHARAAGVVRFVFSSSCSNYGAAGGEELDETAELRPVTAYGESKVLAERDLRALADDRFSPVILRNATAYGTSPRLRLDIVLNDLVAAAVTSGRIALKSDGTPWRPMVHVEDIGSAFLATLAAPRELVHDRVFNVGGGSENYRVIELAQIVEETVPGASIEIASGASADARDYRVDCSLIERSLGWRPAWNARTGAQQLATGYREAGLSLADWQAGPYVRLRRLRALLEAGTIDEGLRFPATAGI